MSTETLPATHVEITLTNETAGHTFYRELEPLEGEWTSGELYRMALRDYGRCTSRVYVDSTDGPRAVGWVFESRQPYDGETATYLRRAWVIPLVETKPAMLAEMTYALDGSPS